METLVGRVTTGRGDFGRWIAALAPLYRAKTGLDLFPGTLNLRLDRPWRLPREVFRIEPAEYGGRVGVSLVPCRVLGRGAFLVRTDANERGDGDHPHEVVEIAADVGLRAAFGLRDGDEVVVELDGDAPAADG
jgi:riboflavin kinase, archaea type